METTTIEGDDVEVLELCEPKPQAKPPGSKAVFARSVSVEKVNLIHGRKVFQLEVKEAERVAGTFCDQFVHDVFGGRPVAEHINRIAPARGRIP
jgi:hypothetical protein